MTGNLNSNAIFNPNDVPPPTDLMNSERDSELEKYIRNKYQFRKLMRTSRGFSSSSKSKTSQRADSDLASTSLRPFSNSPTVAAGPSRAREMLTPQGPKAQTTVNAPPPTATSASGPSAPSLLIDPATSTQTQQPPLQILASAPAPQPAVSQMPDFASSLQTQHPQSVAHGVWGDMMAIQSGPAPVPQQHPLLFTQQQQQYLSPVGGVGVGVVPTFTGMSGYGAMASPGVVNLIPSTPQSSISLHMGSAMNGMMLPQANGMFTISPPQIPLQSTPSPSLFTPSAVQLQPQMQMQMPMMTTAAAAAATPEYHSLQPQAVFQSMSMMQQQLQPQAFGAAVNQPLYTGVMPPAGGVHPQQPFAGMMNPGSMGQQQWPGNANTNPYASGAPHGHWYG